MNKVLRGLLLVFLAAHGMSQSIDRLQPYAHKPQFFCEAHIVPAAKDKECEILVMYRLPYDALSFVRSKTPSTTNRYTAHYSLAIECTDTTGIIRMAKMIHDSVLVDSFENTNSVARYVQKAYSFIMSEGQYSVSVEIVQNNATLHKSKLQTLQLSFCKSRIYTKPIVISEKNNVSINAANCSGGVVFGSGNAKFLVLSSNAEEDETWNYSCKRISQQEDEPFAGASELQGKAIIESLTSFRLSYNNALLDVSEIQTVKSNNTGLVQCDIQTSQLSPGKYEFTMHKKRSKDTLRYQFEVLWMNVPLSLRSTQYAVASMYYLLTEKEYDDMQDGNEKEMRKKIFEWWKKKDPTPTTLYNEAMMAYFGRVDQARMLYQTPMETDGMKTERGKIYILFGAPDIIQTSSNPDEPSREIWIYNNKVKKRITFEANPKSVFRVTKVEGI